MLEASTSNAFLRLKLAVAEPDENLSRAKAARNSGRPDEAQNAAEAALGAGTSLVLARATGLLVPLLRSR